VAVFVNVHLSLCEKGQYGSAVIIMNGISLLLIPPPPLILNLQAKGWSRSQVRYGEGESRSH